MMLVSTLLILLASSALAAIPSDDSAENDDPEFVDVCQSGIGVLSMAPVSKFLHKIHGPGIITVYADASPEFTFQCQVWDDDLGQVNMTMPDIVVKGSRVSRDDDDKMQRTVSYNRFENLNQVNKRLPFVKCYQSSTLICHIELIMISQDDLDCHDNGTLNCDIGSMTRQIQPIGRNAATNDQFRFSAGLESTFEFSVAEGDKWAPCENPNLQTLQGLENANKTLSCPSIIVDQSSCERIIRVRRTTASVQQASLGIAAKIPTQKPKDSFFHACVIPSGIGMKHVITAVLLTVVVAILLFGTAIGVYVKFRKKSPAKRSLQFDNQGVIYHRDTGAPLSDTTTCTKCSSLSDDDVESAPGYCKQHMAEYVMSQADFQDIMASIHNETVQLDQFNTSVHRKFLLHRQLSGDPYKIDQQQPLNKQVSLLRYDPKLEISRDNFILGMQLGKGNFGCVREGTATGIFHEKSETKVAIKCPNNALDYDQVHVLLCEMKILSNIDKMHVNLVNLLGSCTTTLYETGELWILLEFCAFGDMKQYLMDHFEDFTGAEKDTKSRLLVQWAYHIAKGMEYLARRHIMHGDLAARNVLIGDGLVAKISDFGLSKTFYDNIQYSKTKRTEVPVKWMAIEYLRYHKFTITSDVWSYGVVFWEIFSLGEDPYSGMDPQLLKEELENGYRLQCPQVLEVDWFNQDVYDKVTKPCWITNAVDRASFGKIVSLVKSLLGAQEMEEYRKAEEEYSQMNQIRSQGATKLSPPKQDHSQNYLKAKPVSNENSPTSMSPARGSPTQGSPIRGSPIEGSHRPPKGSPFRAPSGYSAVGLSQNPDQTHANGAGYVTLGPIPHNGDVIAPDDVTATNHIKSCSTQGGYTALSTILNSQEGTANGNVSNGYVTMAHLNSDNEEAKVS